MSEERFYITDTGLGLDTESDEMYNFGDEEDFCRLFDKLNEQQATISALKEENEQLRENLHNCRLNKNIIREKLKLWQDAHKEYNIYSIKDFEESFEIDAKINKEKGI